jgi:hypothetical protein
MNMVFLKKKDIARTQFEDILKGYYVARGELYSQQIPVILFHLLSFGLSSFFVPLSFCDPEIRIWHLLFRFFFFFFSSFDRFVTILKKNRIQTFL